MLRQKAQVKRQKRDLHLRECTTEVDKRFSRVPLILFGHSWGTIIATGMAQQRPDLLAAYVGTGQVSSWAGTVQFQFDFLKQRYKANGDGAALAALEAIGKPDSKNVKQYFGDWVRRLTARRINYI